jgi:predicted TIM-barrel fold metal-dependent hydrolase
MARDGYHVIDVHHHSGTLEALGIRIGPEGVSDDELWELEFETRVATLDATGVDQAVILPGHGYLRPAGLADTQRENDRMAAYRDRRPDRFPAALGVVEPLYGKAGLDELARLRHELGLAGVTFHTRFQGVSTNSPLVVDLVRRMAELALVPFVHGVAEVADEALWRVRDLARAVPDTTMVVLDAFSSHEQSEQALRLADDAPNVVLDTSLSHGVHHLGRLVAEFGPDRLVFGTDVYSHVRPQRDNPTLDAVLGAGWPPEVTAAVLSGTARRVLGLGG